MKCTEYFGKENTNVEQDHIFWYQWKFLRDFAVKQKTEK